MKNKYLNLFFLLIVLVLSVIIIYNNKKGGAEAEAAVAADTTWLWDGATFDGWKQVLADSTIPAEDVFQIRDSVIWFRGDYGYLETVNDYSDYKLHVEWRWPDEPVNSGVFLHINGPGTPFPPCIECQLKHMEAGDFITIGGTTIAERTDPDNIVITKMKESSEKPAGKWNSYDIDVEGDSISIYVNSVLQNIATRTSVTSGKIGLQSEGSPIEFRSVYLLKK